MISTAQAGASASPAAALFFGDLEHEPRAQPLAAPAPRRVLAEPEVVADLRARRASRRRTARPRVRARLRDYPALAGECIHPVRDPIDQPARRRRARHQPGGADAGEPLGLQLVGALDVEGARAVDRGQLGEVLGVRRRLAADDDHHLDLARERLDLALAVLRVGADRVDRANFVVLLAELAHDLGEAGTVPGRLHDDADAAGARQRVDVVRRW